MKIRQILFTGPGRAELVEKELREPGDREVLTNTEYSAISAGTERARITDQPNTAFQGKWPKAEGYCAVARVAATGREVTRVKPGDRVLVYHGSHSDHCVVNESQCFRVKDETIRSIDAAFVVIAAMPLGGMRKTELEPGESAMIIGQGILGIFGTQLCRIAGACPIIAADFSPERRALALTCGADYALDPSDKDFTKKVKDITGNGANVIIEVTGSAAALVEALDCAAPFARISLLGCTRVSDTGVDFYTQVHRPGVKLIGAHNMARPKIESRPYNWTNEDDCQAILRFIKGGRFKIPLEEKNIFKPQQAPEVYARVTEAKDYPSVSCFDWRE